jgi:hypothetical protein
MLAQLHQARLEYPDVSPRPNYPPLQELDWGTNRMWRWDEVEHLLFHQPEAVLNAERDPKKRRCVQQVLAQRSEIAREREPFRDWGAALRAAGDRWSLLPSRAITGRTTYWSTTVRSVRCLIGTSARPSGWSMNLGERHGNSARTKVSIPSIARRQRAFYTPITKQVYRLLPVSSISWFPLCGAFVSLRYYAPYNRHRMLGWMSMSCTICVPWRTCVICPFAYNSP